MQKRLIDLKEGTTAKVNFINCGKGLKHRLCSLGLGNGEIIEVLKNDNSGPVIIKVLDTKIAIGRGQAEQIVVDYN